MHIAAPTRDSLDNGTPVIDTAGFGLFIVCYNCNVHMHNQTMMHVHVHTAYRIHTLEHVPIPALYVIARRYRRGCMLQLYRPNGV